MTGFFCSSARSLSILQGVRSDAVRLKFMRGTWVGCGQIDADVLDGLSAIASASPYSVMLVSDGLDMTLANRVGYCDHRNREIRVALRGEFSITLAHETFHSCQPMLSDDDTDHLAATVERMFPVLSDWQRRQGWTTDPGEREACLYASWRCRSVDGFRPEDERTEAIFRDVADGRYAGELAMQKY